MTNFKEFFRGKKITLMGLGLLGRGVGDALFLAEGGAQLTVTDLKNEEQLQESLKKLKKFKNIRYVLGEHRLEDFSDCDFVLKAAGVSLDSIYIKEARKNNIPIRMSAAIFTRFSGLPVVGVTGTRGKSTVTHLIKHLLESVGRKVILGGNVRGVSNLQLLKKVARAEIAVLELDSWQLQGFEEEKISPHISVFTNFLSDHVNYYKNDLKQYFLDKSQIFKYQQNGDTLILGEQVIKNKSKRPMKSFQHTKGGEGSQTKSKVLIAKKNLVPKSWKIKIPGEHNRENIACALMACRVLGLSDDEIKNGVESFVGVPGRLEFL
ncbi:MAG: UDP-N-acetylmuramoyl-L-alanine--D-glutamate ligase, partial [Candidatus Liptonbacteria bacterium]|nr:UDP-N-acetylmuramoyl-L-alanine--D-glutamate ligase [Candidatus Liptonbacteria bacterium]